MEAEKPPYDASVENIRSLCEDCRDVSNAEDDVLKEKTDELDGTTFDRNLEAAVLLGLFEKDEDGFYTPTKQGKKIGYGPDDGEEVKIFRNIIRDNQFYNQLLEIVGDDLKKNSDEHYLTRDDVMKQIGINFDFGVGDRTLESASATFLKVLDAAGIGTYKQGRGGYPTRLVINDEYNGFVESVTKARDTEESQSGTGEENEIDEEENVTQTQLDQVDDGTSEQKFDNERAVETEFQELDSSDSVKNEVQKPAQEIHEEVVLKDVASSSTDVQIDIKISSSDWESEEVIKFLESIQSE